MNNYFKSITLVLFVIVAMISCTTQDVIPEPEKEVRTEMSILCESLDSLQSIYNPTISRGATAKKWALRFLCGTVDASVATVTSETGPVGAFVCGTIASGLYEDYFNRCVKRNNDIPNRRKSLLSTTAAIPTVVFNQQNATFVDSIGYYHNAVLEDIRNKGISFVDDAGKIDFYGYFNEVVKESKKYGIESSVKLPETKYFVYIESVIRHLSVMEEGNEEVFLSSIFNENFKQLNIGNSRTQELKTICKKIIYNDLCIEGEKSVEYGTKVNDLIVGSNLSCSEKQELQIANNIAINSSIYWNSK